LAVDSLDNKILKILSNNSRITLAELGKETGLSSPGVSDRIKRLESQGSIRGFTVKADLAKAGFPLLCFIQVSLGDLSGRDSFLTLVEKLPEILECHHAAGDFDYLLKVRCRDTEHLEEIISEKIKGNIPQVYTRTTIMLSTFKENYSPFEG